jgi:uncharacterized damage-inducible protein DinB
MDTLPTAAPFTVAGFLKLREWTQYSLGLLFDHVATIPADKLHVEHAGFGAATLRDQLYHISDCEAFWECLLTARAWDWPFEDAQDVAALRRACDESYARMRACLSSMSDGELARPRELTFPGGGRAAFSPALVVQHVITHAFHHKGQAVAMCRLLGHPAPETDLDANHGRE